MKRASNHTAKRSLASKRPGNKSFTVVAIGASLGGLKAVSLLLKHLPADTGMAFIYVQHLSPDHKSFLPTILAKTTKMKVQEIEDTELMKPNNIYVIPYNKGIEVTNGHIKLIPRSKENKAISIDVLFSSLAETHKENVVGVILSGNGHDGTIGIKAIKDAGGITIVQDRSAHASSMPRSAIASGAVDFILSPKEISDRLTALGKNRSGKLKLKQRSIEDNNPDLKNIFGILHKEEGVDFTNYKMPTIIRRLNNRILQSGVKTIKEYAKFLVKNNNEKDLLYRDLLINVTDFFRDAETFRYLKTTFLPKLLKSKGAGDTIRIWVPACSTGQEAYSIAMLIAELQDNKTRKIPVKIFATDLSERVIRDARIGEYSQSDIKSISKNNLERFFTKNGDNYYVVKELREMCVFAPHNILHDPPFLHMDIVSCRNLLIYFDAAAQKKVLGTLHFALNENGYLMLGKSETKGTASQLFSQVNPKFKIYSRKKNIGVRKVPELAPHFSKNNTYDKNVRSVPKKTSSVNSTELDSAIDAVLLSHYMPACAVINKDMEILQFRGSTSLYLTHPSGKASLNIFKMTRPEFALELRNAIHKAITSKQPVHKSGIEIKIGSSLRMMSLEVSPLKIEWDELLLLIVFTLQEEVENFENGKAGKNIPVGTALKDRRIKKLSKELNTARAEMHSVIESQETAYEKLQAANEEIVSTNEEFQTLNEELETSKEEIEATNEELISTNQELKTHNELLGESYDYSEAIIDTIHEPMLILNHNLHVKSASKSFYKKYLVSKEETEGKSLFELGNKQWNIPKLRKLLDDVLSKNAHFENFEVAHVFPGIGEKVMLLNANRIVQKTHREKLILLAIEDITERFTRQRKEERKSKDDIKGHKEDKLVLEKAVLRRTAQLEQKNIELEMRATEMIRANKKLSAQDDRISHLAAIVESSQESIISKSIDGVIKSWNIGAEKMFGYTASHAIGKNISLIIPTEYLPEEKKILERIRKGDLIEDYETIRKRKNGVRFHVAITVSPLKDKAGKIIGFSKIARDITARKKSEKQILEKTEELSSANKELALQNKEKEKRAAELMRANKDLTTFTYVSSHDLQEPLRKIQNFASYIVKKEEKNLSDEGKGYFKRMQETANRMQALIEDLLTYSRAKSDERKFEKTDLGELLNEVKTNLEEVILSKKASVKIIDSCKVNVVPFQFRQLMHNLIGNSLKFSKPDVPPKITISCTIEKGSELNFDKLSPKSKYCHVSIVDNGIGFDSKYQARIFEVFQRLHSHDEYKGTGIGLAICKRIIENHRGFIRASGKLNKGARFDIYIPG